MKLPGTAKAIEQALSQPFNLESAAIELKQLMQQDSELVNVIEQIDVIVKKNPKLIQVVREVIEDFKIQRLMNYGYRNDAVNYAKEMSVSIKIDRQNIASIGLKLPEIERIEKNSPNNFKIQGSNDFVGREYELRALHEHLQMPGAVSLLTGIEGVGKTELAVQYARKYEADYTGGICWLNAQKLMLGASIVQFVPHQNFSREVSNVWKQVQWCFERWQPIEGLVLVVLDDVMSLESCQNLLPKGDRFRVLITTKITRLQSLGKQGGRGAGEQEGRGVEERKKGLSEPYWYMEEICLNVFSPQESVEFLARLIGQKRVEREFQTAQQLCECLGYLPLGVELVGSYLVNKSPNWTISKMLHKLKQQLLRGETISRSTEIGLDTAQMGVFAAFELGWRELQPKAQHLAALLSLFAPEIFLWEWVESATELLCWVSEDVEIANEQLYDRHLIQWVEDVDGNYKIKMHPLIRKFFKVKLAAMEQAVEIKRAFAETFVAIAKKIPDSPSVELINSFKDAIPHLVEVAQNLMDVVSDEDVIWVFAGLGRFYSGQGLFAIAQSWSEQCIVVVAERLGNEHLDIAGSYNNLAAVYYAQGRYGEAESLFMEALEIRQRLLGSEHPEVATSYNNLALVYTAQGRYADAEPLFMRALELRQKLLGQTHLEVATSYNNLALVYKAQGRYADAEPLFMRTLILRQRLLGLEHPDVATSYNNLALLYNAQGKYTKAEPLFIKTLELNQRLFGTDHPEVATGYNNLALLYDAQGRYDEAELLFIKALELSQKLFGQEHPYVVTCYNNLALLYSSQERYGEAEPLFITALDLSQKLFGQEHPYVATSYSNLALLYSSQERYSDAEPLFIQALTISQRLLGQKHPQIAMSYNNLALLYYAQRKYDDAESLFIQAVEIAEESLGRNHTDTITIRNNLKLLYDN